jgi:methyltransferase (TIGR00027 family)
MATEAGKTASGPTALVAIEQYYPKEQRVVDDDLAYRILPFSLRAFVQLTRPGWARTLMMRASERDIPGMWSGMLCRKRYIDEKLVDSASDIDAVVNLGAGLDTRTYRLPALTGIPVWEVDLPENIRQKQAGLRRAFRVLPPNVTLVAMDFNREELDAVLKTHGYSAARRTFFIWEGVTQYLTETGLGSTFEFLSRAMRGSRLVFTYVRKDFIEGRAMYGWERAYRQYVTSQIWTLGLEPEGLAHFLGDYGWRLLEDVGYHELAERYVTPTGRALDTTAVERIAHAEKM